MIRSSEAPTVSWSGARACFVGPSLELAPHTNAAATVVVGLESEFGLRLGDAPLESHRISVIPPGARHHLHCVGRMAFLYLDGLSDDYRALSRCDWEAGCRRVRAVSRLDVDSLCRALEVLPRRPPDPRVAAAVAALRARPSEFTHIGDVAAQLGLSDSRTQRLLRREVGVPFRRFRRWCRMAVVARVLADGGNLTRAAHEAGFASSAHLSTSFRAMFGIPPRALLALGTRFVVRD